MEICLLHYCIVFDNIDSSSLDVMSEQNINTVLFEEDRTLPSFHILITVRILKKRKCVFSVYIHIHTVYKIISQCKDVCVSYTKIVISTTQDH